MKKLISILCISNTSGPNLLSSPSFLPKYVIYVTCKNIVYRLKPKVIPNLPIFSDNTQLTYLDF